MVDNCGICGQFTDRTIKKSVRIRGLDRRDGIEKLETGIIEVTAGECCGLAELESALDERDRPTYQRHLNQTPEGEVRFVVLVSEEIEEAAVEQVMDPSSARPVTEQLKLEGAVEVPIRGERLPETFKQWFHETLENRCGEPPMNTVNRGMDL
jgi:hypothetical protein